MNTTRRVADAPADSHEIPFDGQVTRSDDEDDETEPALLAFSSTNDEAIQVTQVEQIPEPLTLALVGIRLASLGFSSRKRS